MIAAFSVLICVWALLVPDENSTIIFLSFGAILDISQPLSGGYVFCDLFNNLTGRLIPDWRYLFYTCLCYH